VSDGGRGGEFAPAEVDGSRIGRLVYLGDRQVDAVPVGLCRFVNETVDVRRVRGHTPNRRRRTVVKIPPVSRLHVGGDSRGEPG
jgi:hypothetical protein